MKPLPDDRKVKNPINAYLFFVREKINSPDVQEKASGKNRMHLIAAEWADLSDTDKEVRIFRDASACD